MGSSPAFPPPDEPEPGPAGYRYPPRRLLGDYARGLAGFALTAGPILGLDLRPVTVALFWLLAAVFLAFIATTLRRHLARVVVTDESITVSPPPIRIAWDAVTRVALRYYGPRGGRPGLGVLELDIWSGARRVRVDSRLTGFDRVAGRAAAAARREGVVSSAVSAANFTRLERTSR